MKSRSIAIQGLIAFAAAALANVIAIPFIASKELRISLLVISVIVIVYVFAVLFNLDDRKSERQRETELLKRTRVFWIEPFLDKLTDGPRWLQVDKAWLTRDHSNPKQIQLEILPSETAVSDIFVQARGALVMLGAPGSGKTITIYHYVLRTTLALTKNVPFRYIPFLNQAAALGLLTRVRGAYLFYHPKVKERFTLRDKRSKTGNLSRKGGSVGARPKEALPHFGSLISSL